ncbi:hypothetical protein JW898_03730 [Candidatus Woesearchaeota archaeon]|nr:hypothetical protein [Candidatus Woesearchaeota archaeon]
MALLDISGRVIAADFFSNYGNYLGGDGRIMTFLKEYSPLNQIIWLGFIFGVYLLVRDVREEGFKGVGLPVGLILFTLNFIFNSPFSMFLTYFSVVILCVFIFWRGKSLSQGGYLGMIALIAGISFLLFGNILALPIFGGIGALALWGIKAAIKKTELGSGEEKRLEKEAGFDPSIERKIRRRELKAERLADKEGMLGEVTEAEAEVEERNVELEGHAAALAAGVEKISRTMTELDNAEISAEQRDMKVLEMASAVDRHIKQHAMDDVEDSQKAAELTAYAKKLVDILMNIATDAEFVHKAKEHSFKAIEHTTEVMTEAAKHAGVIINSEIRVEKAVRSRANKEIDCLRKKVADKEKNIDALFAQRNSARGEARKQLDKQLGQIEEQRDMLKKSVSEVEDIRNKINTVLAKGRRVLKAMRGEAKKMIAAEKEVAGFAENMEKLEGHLGENVEKIHLACEEFRKAMEKLETDLPEQVVVEATKHAANIFEQDKTFITSTIDFNKNEILPFIIKNGELVQRTWHIEKAADFGNKVSRFVAGALEQLAKMAAAIGNQKEVKQAKKLIEIDEMQEQISRYADRKTNKIKAEVKKSYWDLGEAVKSVRTQISFLEKELSSTEAAEKETIDALNTAMTELTKIRRKQFTQLKSASEAAQAQLAKAKKFERKEKAAA